METWFNCVAALNIKICENNNCVNQCVTEHQSPTSLG